VSALRDGISEQLFVTEAKGGGFFGISVSSESPEG
jgi:hypothetical protein